MKNQQMTSSMVRYKIVSIDGRIFGFALGNAYGIKLDINEGTYLSSLIGFSKINRDEKIGCSLNIFD